LQKLKKRENMHKKFLFKVHLILGLSAGFVLMIIGLTGSILSFEKEIIQFVNKDTYFVKNINEPRLSIEDILNDFNKKIPDAKINALTFSKDKNSSLVINIASKDKKARKGINYYINPYTAEILPDIKGEGFFKFIEDIHRRLTFGDLGKQIVAASVLSLLLLMISGVYIYWPRIKNAFFKSITFKFKTKGRAFLSTIHSAIGIWVIPFYLISCLTGLYFSYDWYSNSLHSLTGVEKQKKMPAKSEENLPLAYTDVQKALDLFNENIKEYEKINIRFAAKNETYTFSYLPVKATHDMAMNKIELDINTNKVISHEKFENKSMAEKLMKSILALHTGEYFGLFGKIMMFTTSLLMSLFTITGLMMYMGRKKKKHKAVV
jgi:sulfite reductase (NADPH) flavoprotein alpha-component